MNYQQVPFFRLIFCFISGIVLAQLDLWSIRPVMMGVLSMIVILLMSRNYTRIWSFSCVLIFILFGFIHANLYQESSVPSYFSKNDIPQKSYHAKVIDLKNKGERLNLSLEIYEIISEQNTVCKERIVASVKEPSDDLKKLVYGDCISFASVLRRPLKNLNPGGFNYRKYLKYQNVHYQCFLKSDDVQLLNENKGNRLLTIAFRLRQRFVADLQKYIERKDEFSITAAMILGERDYLSKEIATSFSETGSMHVLAVSGLHVGIVSMLLMFVLRLIPDQHIQGKIIKTILMLSGIWGFALLTGLAPAVMRAATMFSFFLVGKLWTERINIYNVLYSSAFLMLLFDPLLLFNLSFQFSYLALLSIVYFYPIISSFLVFKFFLANKIWDLVAVSLSAQILVFPLTIIYFHKFPVYFFLSGIIAIPVAFLVLCLGIILLLNIFFISLNTSLSILLQDVLSFFIWSMKEIQSFPFAVMQNVYLDTVSALIFYGICFVFMLQYSFDRNKKLLAFLTGLCLLFLYQNMKFTSQSAQRKIFIYCDREDLSMDFVVGHTAYAFNSSKKEFTHGFRNESGIYDIISYQDADQDLLKRDKEYQFRFGGLTLSRISENTNAKEIVADVILIDSAYDDHFEYLFNAETHLILLPSMSWKDYNVWVNTLESRAIKYYDIRTSGALDLLAYTQKSKE